MPAHGVGAVFSPVEPEWSEREMILRKSLPIAVVAVVSLAALPADAEAGFYREFKRAAWLVGFDLFSDNNVLTGGREFLVTNTFNGNPIEYGPWSLTLQGPLSVAFSTANRPYQSLDFSFGTSPSGSAPTSTLAYSFDMDLGETTASVSGTLLVDGGLSFDQLGFYSANLDVSSRKTLMNDGPYGGQVNEYDFDLGPVNIQGNIFIDVIALITQPLFDAAEVDSPFASLTARYQLQSIVNAQTADLLAMLQSGVLPGDATAQRGFTLALTESGANSTGFGPFDERGDVPFGNAIVPEPTILLLMLAGLPFLMRRRGA